MSSSDTTRRALAEDCAVIIRRKETLQEATDFLSKLLTSEHSKALTEVLEMIPKPYDVDTDKETLIAKVPSDMKQQLTSDELMAMTIGGMVAHNECVTSIKAAINKKMEGL